MVYISLCFADMMISTHKQRSAKNRIRRKKERLKTPRIGEYVGVNDAGIALCHRSAGRLFIRSDDHVGVHAVR